MNDTSAVDLTKPLVGMTPFPPANEVFDQNEVFLVEHLHLCSALMLPSSILHRVVNTTC